MSIVRCAALLLCLAPLSARAARPLTLPEALALAQERSPGLITVQAEVAASRARLEGAALLLQSNPEVEGSAGPRSTPDGRYSQYSASLTQRLEIFGQRGARKDAARAVLGSAEARLAARRVELAAEVRESFARWLGAAQRERITIEALDLARQALVAAETRQASGAASRIEVNAARAALGRAARERATSTQRLATARAAVVLLVGLDPSEEIVPEGSLSPDSSRPVEDAGALIRRAIERRPELAAARLEVDAAAAEGRLATREALPSPRLGVSLTNEGGLGGDVRVAQGILAFDLPLFNRNQAARGVASARLAQAERTLEALTRAVSAEVGVASIRLASARAGAEAYAGGLLGGLEENMQLATEAYRAGKLNYFELLVIRRETFEARLGSVDALEELQSAEAGVARATGSLE